MGLYATSFAHGPPEERDSSVDATIIAQNPMMKPHIINMESNIASNLGLEVDTVNIKATTTDGLGVIGREEGIACMSVATLEKII